MSIRKTVVVITGLVLAAAVFAALSPERRSASADPSAGVERGRYLVASIGCADCHASKIMGREGPEPDMTRFLAGSPENGALPAPPQLPAGPWIAVASADLTAWSGPWGISYAANLTPDENTGIGSWSEDTFVKALRTGRHMGVSRPILPPMPWTALRNLTDEDLRAVYAYLRTIPPVHNRVPEPVAPRAVATDAPH
jgi:mono/diheme cytochrome c family protein